MQVHFFSGCCTECGRKIIGLHEISNTCNLSEISNIIIQTKITCFECFKKKNPEQAAKMEKGNLFFW